ncbi:hypothetical protein PENANT_c023G06914 [Penicillium antarcticum]|uniref:Uncharacterized protein n=1 Tax=Penicillium antarcticum TaxID=416450 RepID=A0A1V6Q013_9EURO|nr:uncharacterized protein N7508_006206 [Penicillium antarcticum]KAJ5301343.1 hypothetical protein N7508_006206 [Penicillium antarcticum]OQD82046.1 hypothetical protein PENANT_c023G06914 [Penicillium antarcticum]
MKSMQSQTRDTQPTRFTSSTVNIDSMTPQVYDVAYSHNLSPPSSVYSTTSSAPALVWDPLTTKQRTNIAQWIDSTPDYDSIEEDMEKSSCNSRDETLVNEDLSPIQLEAIPPFPRSNLSESSLYQLHNQLAHPRTSSFTELIDEDLIDPRLVPVVADSDWEVNNSMLPSMHKSSPTVSWIESPEPEFSIVLIVQFVSETARKACRVLRKKKSRDKELDK